MHSVALGLIDYELCSPAVLIHALYLFVGVGCVAMTARVNEIAWMVYWTIRNNTVRQRLQFSLILKPYKLVSDQWTGSFADAYAVCPPNSSASCEARASSYNCGREHQIPIDWSPFTHYLRERMMNELPSWRLRWSA